MGKIMKTCAINKNARLIMFIIGPLPNQISNYAHSDMKNEYTDMLKLLT